MNTGSNKDNVSDLSGQTLTESQSSDQLSPGVRDKKKTYHYLTIFGGIFGGLLLAIILGLLIYAISPEKKAATSSRRITLSGTHVGDHVRMNCKQSTKNSIERQGNVTSTSVCFNFSGRSADECFEIRAFPKSAITCSFRVQ